MNLILNNIKALLVHCGFQKYINFPFIVKSWFVTLKLNKYTVNEVVVA